MNRIACLICALLVGTAATQSLAQDRTEDASSTPRQRLAAELNALQAELQALTQRHAQMLERVERAQAALAALPKAPSAAASGTGTSNGTTKDSIRPTPPLPKPAAGAGPAATQPAAAKPRAAAPKKRSRATAGNGLVSVRYLFESAAKARAAQQELKARGIDSYIAEGQGSYRVYAGAYIDEPTAMRKARQFGTVQGTQPDIFIPQ